MKILFVMIISVYGILWSNVLTPFIKERLPFQERIVMLLFFKQHTYTINALSHVGKKQTMQAVDGSSIRL